MTTTSRPQPVSPRARPGAHLPIARQLPMAPYPSTSTAFLALYSAKLARIVRRWAPGQARGDAWEATLSSYGARP